MHPNPLLDPLFREHAVARQRQPPCAAPECRAEQLPLTRGDVLPEQRIEQWIRMHRGPRRLSHWPLCSDGGLASTPVSFSAEI